MKLFFSPTTLQGDIWALAWYYQQRLEAGDDIDLAISVDNVKSYLENPLQKILPFSVPLIERTGWLFQNKIKSFNPDFLFCDNHLPSRKVFQNLVYLWHGFGWKEQRADIEFNTVHSDLDSLVGGVKNPSPNFIHQCYGNFELQHRVEFTQFHESNCLNMGMLYADYLLNPPVTRAQAAEFYPFKDATRPCVLLGFTWGFGRVFERWDVQEVELIDRLLKYLADREVNVIFRLHDRKRYEPEYQKMLENAANRYGNVFLKYKDHEMDNLLDVVMSDVIVSNFSGIIVYAYFTGAASIHINPMGLSDESHPLYRFKRGKQVLDTRASYMWKMPPEENGGMLASCEEELFASLEKAIDNPSCCQEISREFNKKYMETTDGNRCSSLDGYLRSWHSSGQKPV
ncbi:hypothetical protein KKF34_18935 [Myxococcota bacterium]|nr:hypothetical protein [Myxococcota bacterium]MBU1379529.1 hypothetical protein [Myxococcota bacterium]MBU1498963.1 hypothetical protein [Myxococcota bacterium]